MKKWSFINIQAFGGQGTKKGSAGTVYFEVNYKHVSEFLFVSWFVFWRILTHGQSLFHTGKVG